jgi:hypothetical protein
VEEGREEWLAVTKRASWKTKVGTSEAYLYLERTSLWRSECLGEAVGLAPIW